ncbi:unnamed protein product [Ixodes pacificus]
MADTDFEDVIEKIGGFGRFQKTLLWLYLAPVSLLVPGYFVGLIFMLSVPEHSCVLPSAMKTLNLTESKAAHLRYLVITFDTLRMRTKQRRHYQTSGGYPVRNLRTTTQTTPAPLERSGTWCATGITCPALCSP